LAGHGSSPDLGVNAAEYAVRFITRLMELREDMKSRTPDNSRFEPPWTTMNIGGIRGGVAHNVIVSKAEVDWEFRPVQKSDFDYMKSSIASYVDTMLLPAMRAVHPDARIDTQTIGEVDGLEPMDENAIKDLVMELTGANAADVVPFGTEAGLFQSMSLSAIVCGPGSIAQAHKADEYVALDQLEACLNMLDGLGQKMT
jgi:acetylornithine deacetylase